MNEKKKIKKATTTKTTRKFAEETFKVNKCMTSATELWSCRQGSIAETSGDYSQVVQHSSVFVQRYYIGEKKKRKRETPEM